MLSGRRLKVLIQVLLVMVVVVALLRRGASLSPFGRNVSSAQTHKIIEEPVVGSQIVEEHAGGRGAVVVPGRKETDTVVVDTTAAGEMGLDGDSALFGEQHRHGQKNQHEKSPVAPGKEEGKTGGEAPIEKPGGNAPHMEVRPHKEKSKNSPAMKHILNLYYDMGSFLMSLNEIINTEPNDGKWGFFSYVFPSLLRIANVAD